ncbi:carbohydrate ABC transporter substrate-binding protein, CUT1 family [Streptomyces sp. Ag82_O1-12]|uniref:ABC transporter substrate-binding protein n=1 Tax=unclassified Streptomyces TaxID=2593676 RepID=UPI000BDB6B69|nr:MULTISPECIES: sugar ABC transporter substrate-binding protein [unclassified Streptomyces]SMQ14309.1 carbohydrate ABC transporter substrate-binding protein, CUT1 family [Streptomyces sp. Ag82_O1-12]SOD43335.1 carbohydrate ABC transporter substrate-binding protein, CUT1 family [Streptomyces sp. Ag82_G6-1]
MKWPRIAVRAAVALALAGTTVMACGADGDGSKTLTWSMWADGGEEQQVWHAFAERVSREDPQITIKLETSSFQDYFAGLGTRLDSGDGPCIVSMQSLRTAGYTQGMLPLDDLIAKNKFDVTDFDKSVMEGLSADGKLYALPYDVGPVILTYNKSMFRKAGVPEPKPGWTLAEFESAARKLTGDRKYGFVAAPQDVWMFPMVLTKTGAQPTDGAGGLRLTTPAMTEGVQWYADLAARKKVAPHLPERDSAFFADSTFLSGDVAMGTSGPWALLNLKNQAGFQVGLATIPAGPDGSRTYSAGSGFGISKSCPDPERAFKAITLMTAKKQLEWLGGVGRAYPSRESAQHAWYENAHLAGAREVLEAANATSIPLRTTKHWEKVNQLLNQNGARLFNGASSAKQVLEQVQDQAG